MIKKFKRSSANSQLKEKHILRPPYILYQTVQYLIKVVLNLKENLNLNVFNFISDRFRCIRQDFNIIFSIDQNFRCLKETVKSFELMTRFFIVSINVLRDAGKEFDEKLLLISIKESLKNLIGNYIELENLKKTALLKKDVSGKSVFAFGTKHRNEFLCYDLLMGLFENRSGFETLLSHHCNIFPDLVHDPNFDIPFQIFVDLENNFCFDYFTKILSANIFWGNLLSLKFYLVKIQIMAYNQTRKKNINFDKLTQQKKIENLKNILLFERDDEFIHFIKFYEELDKSNLENFFFDIEISKFIAKLFLKKIELIEKKALNFSFSKILSNPFTFCKKNKNEEIEIVSCATEKEIIKNLNKIDEKKVVKIEKEIIEEEKQKTKEDLLAIKNKLKMKKDHEKKIERENKIKQNVFSKISTYAKTTKFIYLRKLRNWNTFIELKEIKYQHLLGLLNKFKINQKFKRKKIVFSGLKIFCIEKKEMCIKNLNPIFVNPNAILKKQENETNLISLQNSKTNQFGTRINLAKDFINYEKCYIYFLIKKLVDFSEKNKMSIYKKKDLTYSIGLILNINQHSLKLMEGFLKELFCIDIKNDKLLEIYEIKIKDLKINIKIVLFENYLNLFLDKKEILDSIYYVDLRSEYKKDYVMDLKEEIQKIWNKHSLMIVSKNEDSNYLLKDFFKFPFFHFQGFLLNFDNIEIYDFKQNLKNIYELENVNSNNFSSIFNFHFNSKIDTFFKKIEIFNHSFFSQKFDFFSFHHIGIFSSENVFDFFHEFCDCFCVKEELNKLENVKKSQNLVKLIKVFKNLKNEKRYLFALNFIDQFISEIYKDFQTVFQSLKKLDLNQISLNISEINLDLNYLQNETKKFKINILKISGLFENDSFYVKSMTKKLFFTLSGFLFDFFEKLKSLFVDNHFLFFDLKTYLLDFFDYENIISKVEIEIEKTIKKYFKIKSIDFQGNKKMNLLNERDDNLLKKNNNDQFIYTNNPEYYDMKLLNTIIKI